MKTSKTFQNKKTGICARRLFKGGLAAVGVALFGSSWGSGICLAQEGDNDVQGVQVLTRGPVHEAFAGIVTFNPVAGVVVQKAPPEAIEEIPPGERPEGNNITWIPGYWAWDDERSDYLWVSGTWRALPPGRQWMAGYWGNSTQGYQWTSGYWADATVQETTYLPAPPATVEDGPNTKAPSRDYGWTPGSWMWSQERYAWSPGYWQRGRSDWDWIPAHYVWTPRGYIYVDGYWDYSVQRRGMLFAPVYFDSGVYSRSGYSYSPSIVLDLAMFVEHLFLRPNYHHYYFGDYYAPRYNQGGIYASYAYQSSRYGYDPIYSHQRWENRENQGWDQLAQANYRYRSDHENARPPQTWSAMRTLDANSADFKQNRMMMATPIDQMTKRKGGSIQYQSVAKEDRNMLAKRGQEMRKTSNERRTLEAKGDGQTSIQKPGDSSKIARVRLPKSPIVGKAASQFKKSQAPPAAQRSPQTDVLGKQPKSETSGRQPKMEKNNPQPDPRTSEAGKRTMPSKAEAAPREKPGQLDRSTKGQEKQAQPTPERRVKEAPAKLKEQPSRAREQPSEFPKNAEKRVQPAPERRVKETPARAQEQPAKSPENVEKKVQPAPERRVKETPATVPSKAQEQPTRRAPEQAPQGETRRSPKEKSSPNPNETEQSGKKDRK